MRKVYRSVAGPEQVLRNPTFPALSDKGEAGVFIYLKKRERERDMNIY